MEEMTTHTLRGFVKQTSRKVKFAVRGTPITKAKMKTILSSVKDPFQWFEVEIFDTPKYLFINVKGKK